MKLLAKLPPPVRKLLVVICLITAGLLPAYYYYKEYTKTKNLLENPTVAAKEETKAIIAKLSKFIDLPSDEEPTLATVTDSAKLKEQPFFTKAENGDKVLIYTKAKKAILYRPSTNKILDVAPINLGGNQSGLSNTQKQLSPSATPSPTTTSTPTLTATLTPTPTPQAEPDLASPDTPTPN